MGQQMSLTTSTPIQRRHITFGVILAFFSIALIIAEVKRPSSSYVGYWVGAIGILPSIFAIVCGVKTTRPLLIVSCFSDFIASCTCVAGAILSLVFFSIHVYAVGWLSVILTTFLLYHAFTIFGELNICCRVVIFGIPDEVSDITSHHNHGRDLPAPPIGFFMPDEVPKPPNYDQLSVRGDPPAYTEACSQRSFVTPTPPPPPTPPRPTPSLYSVDRRRNRSLSAIRIPMSVRAEHRHRSHPSSQSRLDQRNQEHF
ncbi:hypothetical protein ECG_02900 [Echinococcus granulosus]|uniref:Expressed conserved protein n=1 Tax=Echinococcus granulosus TaxID=6210 RepID=U6J7S1_ECHGR|nr:hypothetical protein EGR_01860 [Echinococcus granulosus]EUB63369.1 hypothetical protein EGR_01860 [Echinococcus granulosus]KAH9285123.1 hypothetical protein ECG_02900 [Echinococcus granulosus]CDS20137.1 expressed conserved protein [Echinococcus granulosus]